MPAARHRASTRRPLLRAAGLAAGCLMALAARAAPYAVAVGATVLSKNNCSFTTAAGSVLNFGNIDPSSASNATASVSLTIRCSGSGNPVVYSITSNDGLFSTGAGLPRLRNATDITQFMPYTLNVPLSGSTPKNTSTPITITGTITPAGFAGALVGNYADTVVLTVSP